MNEAAGVEPDISVENTQLTDSGNVSIAENATISKSSVQITYKDFPELQNFQASPALAQHAEVLYHLYTSMVLKLVSVRIIFRGRIRRNCLRIQARNRIIWPQVGFEHTIPSVNTSPACAVVTQKQLVSSDKYGGIFDGLVELLRAARCKIVPNGEDYVAFEIKAL